MSRSYINKLPKEMYTKTLLSLSAKDLKNLCLTDKYAYDVCNDDSFWFLYLNKNYFTSLMYGFDDWKQILYNERFKDMNWIEIVSTIENAKPREIITSFNTKNIRSGENKRKNVKTYITPFMTLRGLIYILLENIEKILSTVKIELHMFNGDKNTITVNITETDIIISLYIESINIEGTRFFYDMNYPIDYRSKYKIYHLPPDMTTPLSNSKLKSLDIYFDNIFMGVSKIAERAVNFDLNFYDGLFRINVIQEIY